MQHFTQCYFFGVFCLISLWFSNVSQNLWVFKLVEEQTRINIQAVKCISAGKWPKPACSYVACSPQRVTEGERSWIWKESTLHMKVKSVKSLTALVFISNVANNWFLLCHRWCFSVKCIVEMRRWSNYGSGHRKLLQKCCRASWGVFQDTE